MVSERGHYTPTRRPRSSGKEVDYVFCACELTSIHWLHVSRDSVFLLALVTRYKLPVPRMPRGCFLNCAYRDLSWSLGFVSCLRHHPACNLSSASETNKGARLSCSAYSSPTHPAAVLRISIARLRPLRVSVAENTPTPAMAPNTATRLTPVTALALLSATAARVSTTQPVHPTRNRDPDLPSPLRQNNPPTHRPLS